MQWRHLWERTVGNCIQSFCQGSNISNPCSTRKSSGFTLKRTRSILRTCFLFAFHVRFQSNLDGSGEHLSIRPYRLDMCAMSRTPKLTPSLLKIIGIFGILMYIAIRLQTAAPSQDRETLKIYDPYYCMGNVVKHFASLGFSEHSSPFN